jgi:hypothetical protein
MVRTRTRDKRQDNQIWRVEVLIAVRYPWREYIFFVHLKFFFGQTLPHLFFYSCSLRVQSISHTIASSHQYTHTDMCIYMCVCIHIYIYIGACTTTTRVRHLSSSYSESEWMALLLTIWQAACAWDRRRERERKQKKN